MSFEITPIEREIDESFNNVPRTLLVRWMQVSIVCHGVRSAGGGVEERALHSIGRQLFEARVNPEAAADARRVSMNMDWKYLETAILVLGTMNERDFYRSPGAISAYHASQADFFGDRGRIIARDYFQLDDSVFTRRDVIPDRRREQSEVQDLLDGRPSAQIGLRSSGVSPFGFGTLEEWVYGMKCAARIAYAPPIPSFVEMYEKGALRW
jgi:hypothetical protein